MKNINWNKIYKFFFYIIPTAAVTKIILSFFIDGGNSERYSYTEYLINYQGGFVRRGFLGEILFMFYEKFNINPNVTVKIFCAITIILLSYFVIRDTLKKGYSALLLVTSSIFFVNFITNNNFWLRKDLFILLLFYIYVRLIGSNINNVFKFLLSNIVLILGVLSHEILFILILPITFFYFLDGRQIIKLNNFINATFKSAVYLLPTIICFFACITNKGDMNTAIAIWNSWFDGEVNYSIAGLGWTIQYALEFTLRVFKQTHLVVIYYPILWLLLLFVFIYIYTYMGRIKFNIWGYKTSNNYKVNESLAILFFQFLAFLTVLPVFCDFSRWFTFMFLSSYIIRLYYCNKYSEALAGSFLEKGINSVARFADNKLRFSNKTIFLVSLILGMPAIHTSSFDHVFSRGPIGLVFTPLYEIVLYFINANNI